MVVQIAQQNPGTLLPYLAGEDFHDGGRLAFALAVGARAPSHGFEVGSKDSPVFSLELAVDGQQIAAEAAGP